MSRPRSTALDLALAALKADPTMLPIQAAGLYGVLRSSISRALKREVCECCGQIKPAKK